MVGASAEQQTAIEKWVNGACEAGVAVGTASVRKEDALKSKVVSLASSCVSRLVCASVDSHGVARCFVMQVAAFTETYPDVVRVVEVTFASLC